MTSRGKFPLQLLSVETEKTLDGWITSYRLSGTLVREDRHDFGETMATAEGEFPIRELELSVEHFVSPCGLAIVKEFRREGRVVRRDVRQEVYDPPSLSGDVGGI